MADYTGLDPIDLREVTWLSGSPATVRPWGHLKMQLPVMGRTAGKPEAMLVYDENRNFEFVAMVSDRRLIGTIERDPKYGHLRKSYAEFEVKGDEVHILRRSEARF